MPITNLSNAQYVFIVIGYIDMRKEIDGLWHVITNLIVIERLIVFRLIYHGILKLLTN